MRLCVRPVTGASGTSTAVVTAVALALDAAILACTCALTRLAEGRTLRPVRTMTEQATSWSALASDERLGGSLAPGCATNGSSPGNPDRSRSASPPGPGD
ncbi:hypothetical protein Slala03_57620 [Streptomyces lavendulae subsp. lavendulae]|uniref:hypothetical protein n=1 Tax=Streptomyces lavendulae TaxID=1914 RepID=UPI0024A33F78|nr:hypothetical protein [Streptomyces lavendulae]GLV86073.1 hypothetical protein Slala03_57620 [Streptomyces lavendulae subsp. lavendulae]